MVFSVSKLIISPRRSMQAEKRKHGHDHNHQANQIYNAVHNVISFDIARYGEAFSAVPV